MAKIKKDNSADYYNVDEGVYKAIVTDIEEMLGDRGTYYIWKFRIANPVYEDEEINEEVLLRGTTPSKLKDESKLDKWLTACGVSSEDGEVVDTDDAVGSKVRVMVEHREGKNDVVYSNVTKVSKPVSKSRKPESQDDEELKKDKKTETEKKKEVPKEESKKSEKKSSKAEESDADLWDFD